MNFDQIKTIAFDADDTLWVNETYFRDTEERFASLLESYKTKNTIDQELFKKKDVESSSLRIWYQGLHVVYD